MGTKLPVGFDLLLAGGALVYKLVKSLQLLQQFCFRFARRRWFLGLFVVAHVLTPLARSSRQGKSPAYRIAMVVGLVRTWQA
jgi:hypothetical protein